MKAILRQITPPIVWRTLVKVKRRRIIGTQQEAGFYDDTFKNASHWKQHYTASRYYPLWTVIADRVRRTQLTSILDIGCGPGQVACLLRDQGITNYVGLDFSPARVNQARTICPEFEFVVADVFKTDRLEKFDYDGVLLMEFLEHIHDDLEVLSRIRSGSCVLVTVPNFPDPAHVRHFLDAAEVYARYKSQLRSLRVDSILANTEGSTYFVLEGYAV